MKKEPAQKPVEFDEDHATDMVLNSMVESLEFPLLNDTTNE